MPRHTLLRPHGYIIITDPEAPTIEYDTHQCCHCGAHFAIIPGSGRLRGYCLHCDGPTCGAEACGKCDPLKRRLGR